MQAVSSQTTIKAFTLVEFLVVIAIIALLLVMIVPVIDRSPDRSTRASCLINQKNIAMGEMMWAFDHNELFPWRVSTNNGGTAEVALSGSPVPHFQVASNSLQLKSLICLTDAARQAASDFVRLRNENVSYFVHLDAATNNSVTILTGDRHLQVNGQPLKPGLSQVASNFMVDWTRELHSQSAKGPIGVIAFTHGHAEAIAGRLPAYFQQQGLPASRLAIP